MSLGLDKVILPFCMLIMKKINLVSKALIKLTTLKYIRKNIV